jgi:hypothetical protein
MPWKGNQQTYYCHSPVLEPESWGPLWLWWWRCGTGVLHFTHFLVPFSAWLNPWDPFGFPARNDQKHIETPCWPLRRSRGSKPNDFKVCEKNAAVEWSICIHLYTYLTLRFHELEVGVAKREDTVKLPPSQVGLIGFSFTYSIISILQWYFGGFWSPTCWNHRNHTQPNSPGRPFCCRFGQKSCHRSITHSTPLNSEPVVKTLAGQNG